MLDELEEDPIGAAEDPIGRDCYKAGMAITSKNKGKSGGARVIYHVRVVGSKVTLLSIYDKGNKENISGKELKDLLKKMLGS